MVESTDAEPKKRSRITLIAVTVGVVIAAVLVAYGFSKSADDREPTSSTPPTIGIIQSPADVATTQGTTRPTEAPFPTNDVPLPPNGTADIGLPPPVTADIPAP